MRGENTNLTRKALGEDRPTPGSISDDSSMIRKSAIVTILYVWMYGGRANLATYSFPHVAHEYLHFTIALNFNNRVKTLNP